MASGSISFWSPNSKKIVFIDNAMKIKMYDITNGSTTDIDQALRFMHGGCEGFSVSWSPDSRWFTYSRDLNNYHNAVYIYDTRDKKNTQVTDGYYNCDNPVFDTEGKYVYFTTNQNYTPYYSDIDNSFIYGNSTQIAVISLKKSTPSILFPKNDTVAVKADELPAEKKKDSVQQATAINAEIDFEGMQNRMEILPPATANYGYLAAVKGNIIYQKLPNLGSALDARHP
ncbi:MAG: PD40 domain-containing protein [Chitinophagaceae bacterium]|nr:PD40 domain-containing protein [Chitinophagaceae bacterium]